MYNSRKNELYLPLIILLIISRYLRFHQCGISKIAQSVFVQESTHTRTHKHAAVHDDVAAAAGALSRS